MAHEVNYVIGPQDDRVPPQIEDQQMGPGLGLQGQDLGGQVPVDRHIQEEVPPGYVPPLLSSTSLLSSAAARPATRGAGLGRLPTGPSRN